MLTLDPMRQGNPQIKLLAAMIMAGLGLLLVGLWWLQVVNRKEYQSSLETQSYKTMRIPATRGRITDRNGELLAETRPSYNLNLYLEEIRSRFGDMYDVIKPQALASLKAQQDAYQAKVGRELTTVERRNFQLRGTLKLELEKTARYLATSNLVAEVAGVLHTPLTLDPEDFHNHYLYRRALPMPILTDLSPAQLARFTESSRPWPGLEVETQPIRIYPHGDVASHVIGHLSPNNDSVVGEDSFYTYRLPDYRGVVGVEYAYDEELRGQAGAKSVLVNNFGYRFEDAVWMPAEPGRNLRLTIDLAVQRAAEQALQRVATRPKAAVVVMDVNNGDILAMASSPRYDPSQFVERLSDAEYALLNDENFRPLINRATQENYAPGSILKPMIGLACLEAGLDPNHKVHVEPYPGRPNKGVAHVGSRKIRDDAGPGDYDFKRALKLSSNGYFVSNGLGAGIDRILELGKRLHLGESTQLGTRQETSGNFPDDRSLAVGWSAGDTANICIGQGKIDVTPLQMAVMTAAFANGGIVLWPRLVAEITDDDPQVSPALRREAPGRIRDHLRVRPQNLQILKDAMLADVEDPDGTGRAAAIRSVRICGKTGTAQITDPSNRVTGLTTWFISFAPYERPKYAVVIMVEGGSSGGGTCAPLAQKIYQVLFPAPPKEVARNR